MWGFHYAVKHFLIPDYQPGRVAATHLRVLVRARSCPKGVAKYAMVVEKMKKKDFVFPTQFGIKVAS